MKPQQPLAPHPPRTSTHLLLLDLGHRLQREVARRQGGRHVHKQQPRRRPLVAGDCGRLPQVQVPVCLLFWWSQGRGKGVRSGEALAAALPCSLPSARSSTRHVT